MPKQIFRKRAKDGDDLDKLLDKLYDASAFNQRAIMRGEDEEHTPEVIKAVSAQFGVDTLPFSPAAVDIADLTSDDTPQPDYHPHASAPQVSTIVEPAPAEPAASPKKKAELVAAISSMKRGAGLVVDEDALKKMKLPELKELYAKLSHAAGAGGATTYSKPYAAKALANLNEFATGVAERLSRTDAVESRISTNLEGMYTTVKAHRREYETVFGELYAEHSETLAPLLTPIGQYSIMMGTAAVEAATKNYAEVKKKRSKTSQSKQRRRYTSSSAEESGEEPSSSPPSPSAAAPRSESPVTTPAPARSRRRSKAGGRKRDGGKNVQFGISEGPTPDEQLAAFYLGEDRPKSGG